jgi:hypothetical protein
MLNITDSVVEDFPHEAAQAMGNCPDGSSVMKPRQEPAEEELEGAALRLHCRLGGLRQDSSYEAVAFGRSGAVVLLCGHI